MATTTRIVIQQAVNLDKNNLIAGKYPRFVVNLGTSITGVTINDLTNAIQETADNVAAAAASAAAAKASQDAAKISENNALASQNAAKASQTAAKTSETNSKTSETNAKTSENAAKTAQTGAELAKTNAETAERNAAESARLAKISETNAANSASAAAISATNSFNSATQSATSATNSKNSADAAAASATAAANSATKAAASEDEAADHVVDAAAEANRAKSEADRAKSVVDAALDAEDIAGFYKSYKTKAEADADVANRVVDEVVQVWNQTAAQYGWYKVISTNGAKSLQLIETENKLVSVNNIKADTNGNVQVTIPGGNPSLWLGEVTLFPYRNTDTVGYSGILLADGRLLNRADYPDLWSSISAGLIPSVSETEWQAGQNQFYSTGDGTTTFRLPNMLQGQALRSATAGETGTGAIKAQIPYITTVNGKAPADATGAITLAWADIGGILPVSKGGTGASTVDGALNNLEAFKFQRTALGNINLNTMDGTKAGVYIQNYDNNASLENNYPKRASGTLVVLPNAANAFSSCSQLYYPYNTDDVYVRKGVGEATNGSVTWGSWKRFMLEGDYGFGGLSPNNSWDSVRVNSFNSQSNGAYHPGTVGFGTTFMHHSDSNYGVQIMGRLNYPMAHRAMNSGTWGDWNYLLSTAKYDSPNEFFNYGARISGGIAITENFSNKTIPEVGVDGFPVNCTAFCYPEGTNAPPTHGVLLGYSGLNQNYRVQNVTYYNGQQDIAYRTYNGDAKAWNEWRRIVTLKGNGSSSTVEELGTKTGFISSASAASHLPSNGGGFQTTYNENRIFQFWINNLGEGYTRFLQDKAANDSTTAWNRIMYWDAAHPRFQGNLTVQNNSNGIIIRGTTTENNQALFLQAVNDAGARQWYIGKGSAAAGSIFYNDLTGTFLELPDSGDVRFRTKDYNQVIYSDCARSVIRRANNNQFTIENQSTAAQNGTMLLWGSASRPSVMEFKLDNGYLFYAQQNTDSSRTLQVAGSVIASNIAASSDRDLKTNLEVVTNAMEKLQKINGYTYRWIDSEMPDAGLIAQEVMEVLPEVISFANKYTETGEVDENGSAVYNEDRYYALNYNGMFSLVVEAAKELDNRLAAKEQEVTELKARMNQLENLVAQLLEKVGDSN